MSERRKTLEAAKLEALKAAREISAKAEAESRDFSPEERAAVSAYMEKARDTHRELELLAGDVALKDELNALGLTVGSLAKSADDLPNLPGSRRKSLGERFANSPEFTGWIKSVASNGQIPDKFKGFTSPAFSFEGIDAIGGAKGLLTGVSDTSGGAIVANDFRGLSDLGAFQRPLTVRDVITVGQTGSDTVEYARVTGFTNAAAPTAEATGAGTIGDGTGGTITAVAGGRKPESSMTLEKVTATVKTIAHWIPATKRALSDAAQIRTLIDNFLEYGLEEELEDQIVNGNGTGENFSGILSTAGTQAQAWDTDLLVTTRKAKTKVKKVGRATATAYLFNPEDNERIDLLREGAGTGAFLFGSPAGLSVQTLWGLPRIESEAIPVGTGLVADWRTAVLWDREQAAIQVSDSHSDFFVRNLVAILAEMRAAFGVLRPSAFVSIDLTA